MTITELAVLYLNQPFFTNPLPKLLDLVATHQSAWSDFPLLYFSDIEDNCTIYLVSGWTTLVAHEEWIQSNRNQELLDLFKPYISGLSLRHIEIDFDKFPLHSAFLGWNSAAIGGEGESPLLPDVAEVIWEARGPEIESNSTTHKLIAYSSTMEAQSLKSLGHRWKELYGESKVMRRVDLANWLADHVDKVKAHAQPELSGEL